MHKIERRECLILAFPVQRRLIAELPAGTTCICDSQAMPKCGERMSKCQRTKIAAQHEIQLRRPSGRLRFANPADAERIKEGFEKAGLSH